MINKIIWQTHNFKEEDLPHHINLCMQTWKMVNPGWEHKYVSHEDREIFIKEKYPNFYSLYQELEPALYKADLWRVLVVYEFGGVYADMDSVCVKPLDYMLKDCNSNTLITEKNNRGSDINNAMFAAPKNCTILKNVMDLVDLEYTTKGNFPIKVDIHTIFSKQALKNNNHYFTAGEHGQNFKTRFWEQPVDYYGEKMLYSEYLKNILELDKAQVESLTRNVKR